MPRRVQNGKDDDGVFPHDEENAIWKTPGEDTPDFGAFAEEQIMEGILDGTPNRGAHFAHEIQTQALFTVFIPERGLGDVRLGFRPDDEAPAHAFSRVRMRASTSSHELPASGSFP